MKPRWLLSALIVAFAATAAGDPSIDAAHSSIIATFRQENVPVDAAFKSFSGRIDYVPANPGASRAHIQVATGSLDLGEEDYDAEVRKAEWLDSIAYPYATFDAGSITAAGPEHLTISGTLTLKGRTQTLTVPVTVSRAGTATVFEGALQISRKYFSIGSAQWNGVVDDIVRVRFHLVQ